MQEAKTGCSGGRVLTSVLGFSVSQRMLRKTEALMKNLISIVVPCFNEQEVLRQTYERLHAVDIPGCDKELVFVDDGSRDKTLDILKQIASEDDEVRVISFSRNFGHQPAVTAGTAEAKGDAVVIIDADLQDPPELIPDMVELWRRGYDIVYGKRTKRHGETFMKKFTAWGYYRFLGMMGGDYIPRDTGDFRLIDRKVADMLGEMKEHNRFLRGMTAWAGFSSIPLEYVRDERAAGETKYTLKKMFKLAGDGITAFSSKPLKLPMMLGAVTCILALVYLILSIILTATGTWPYMHIIFSLLFLLVGGLFVSLGIMGLYISRIYDEAKDRPHYIVRERYGFK